MKLRNFISLAIASLGLMATGLVQAQAPDFGPMAGCHPNWQARRPDANTMNKFREQRLARLHNALKLNAGQEAAWNTFADKMKPPTGDAPPDMAALAQLPTPERLDRMQALAKARQERMAEHTVAIKALYSELTPEQQKIFDREYIGTRGRNAKRGPKARAE